MVEISTPSFLIVSEARQLSGDLPAKSIGGPTRSGDFPVESTLFLLAKHSRPVTELFTVWSSSQRQPPRDDINCSCLAELEEGEYGEDEVGVDEDEEEENGSVHDDGEGEREADTENYEAKNDLQHRELQV
ncbi:hypothetical protein WN944_009309 [Citrus x changshan-huyou]|uniref:Uncharacterized protein n=1 Tax=Citrus x changshan-huyou TaxID=2935761 RepID=A0AAP0QRZ1_9ROSI